MTNLPIDDVDAAIIKFLKQNGRMSNTEIADQLNLSETAIRNRLKRLLNDKIIQIVAVVNPQKMGYSIEGNIKIKTNLKKNKQVEKSLKRLNRLWYIVRIAGAADFDVEFTVKSQRDLHDLIETINQIDGVLGTEVSIRLQMVKNLYDWEKR